MGRVTWGALACAAWIVGGPAFAAGDLALVVPSMNSAPKVQEHGVALSPLAKAIEAALAGQAVPPGTAEKAMLEEIRAFYAARDFEPLWIRDGSASQQMRALRGRMDSAEREGLDPAHYATPSFAEPYSGEAETARAEVEFARAAVRFVTHLSSGRIEPASISPIITQAPERPPAGEILRRLDRTAGVAAALHRFEPPHPDYAALKRRLAELRREEDADEVRISAGPTLRPGDRDARVPVLRERLGLPAATAEPDLYDPALADALRGFQTGRGFGADGVLGPRTLAALNGPSRADRIAAVIVNMERWRWMPRDLGRFHVAVNIPEFTVRVVEEGKIVHETRAVVGKPDSPTPVFSQPMDHLVVNPYWNVPSSIVQNEMLSEIRRDPYGYFSRKGYQVLAHSGGKMEVVDPRTVNWWAEKREPVRIRQVPGDDNALGRIKFMFPNQHAVYLHDTPSKKLFQRDFRAFSHGCVRVDDPLAFADAVLAKASPEWNAGRIEKLYGGAERWINLKNPVPVHLAYFTAASGPDGLIRWLEDIYGFDARLRAAMNL